MIKEKKNIKYKKNLLLRKKLSGNRGYTNFKGKKLPIPLPLFQDE